MYALTGTCNHRIVFFEASVELGGSNNGHSFDPFFISSGMSGVEVHLKVTSPSFTVSPFFGSPYTLPSSKRDKRRPRTDDPIVLIRRTTLEMHNDDTPLIISWHSTAYCSFSFFWRAPRSKKNSTRSSCGVIQGQLLLITRTRTTSRPTSPCLF